MIGGMTLVVGGYAVTVLGFHVVVSYRWLWYMMCPDTPLGLGVVKLAKGLGAMVSVIGVYFDLFTG